MREVYYGYTPPCEITFGDIEDSIPVDRLPKNLKAKYKQELGCSVSRATVALKMVEGTDGMYFHYGVTFCNGITDNFNKKLGRKIAEERMNAGMFIVKVPPYFVFAKTAAGPLRNLANSKWEIDKSVYDQDKTCVAFIKHLCNSIEANKCRYRRMIQNHPIVISDRRGSMPSLVQAMPAHREPDAWNLKTDDTRI